MTALPKLALAAGGIALGVLAYRVQVHDLNSPGGRALAIVAVGWAFLAAGLIAWWRRPTNRLGVLIVAAGVALLARQLRYSHDALLFTLFFALGELGYALTGHAAFAYPSGRITGRAERALVRVGYATVLVLPLAILMVYDGTRPLLFFDLSSRRSLILVAGDAHLARLLQKALEVALYGVLSTLFIVLVARRLAMATPRTRRVLAPLLLAAVAVALRAVFDCVFLFASRPFASDYLFWWQIGSFIALPLALAGGLLWARLARAGVSDLLVELENAPVGALRAALARVLGDPSLELAFWLPERDVYVDAAGTRVELPVADDRRAVTALEHDGEPLAAIVHDPSLLDEPKLVHAAGAAARLSLENARLHAEIRAQLKNVQESRARIVQAADDERRRIERDLHDGAQQRLVALALELRTAQRRFDGAKDAELEGVLESAVGELQAALTDLRELARGVHPAILTEEGLPAALESLASRTRVPVTLDTFEGRLPAQVEATAYFVVCEALANALKYANPAVVHVVARRTNGTLVVVVEDDGVGGARIEEGGGLRGLADRVEALGGTLRIESAAGAGTRVVGEIPCAR